MLWIDQVSYEIDPDKWLSSGNLCPIAADQRPGLPCQRLMVIQGIFREMRRCARGAGRRRCLSRIPLRFCLEVP